MKKRLYKTLSLLCAVVLLLSCSSVIGTVTAAPERYSHVWRAFPPASFGDQPVETHPRAGSAISTQYSSCGIDLPEDAEFDYLALYVKITLNQAAADAFNKGGNIELSNVKNDRSEICWNLESVAWQEGVNEFTFPFRSAKSTPGDTGPFDVHKTIQYFRVFTTPGTAVLESEGEVIFHEISVVDISEGGIEFGATDTYLQLTSPLAATPNTIEASVKVDPAAELTAERYAIFSNLGSADTQPIALSMTATGKPMFTWGDTGFTVDHDVRTGEWVDIAVVRNMADKKFYVYIDGEEVASFDATGTPAISPATAHCIGSDETGATFRGGIADVRAWSDARTAAEIANNRVSKIGNRKNGLAADAEGLLGSWYLLGSLDYVLGTQQDGSIHHNHAVYRGSRADDWVDYAIPTNVIGEDYYTMVFIPDTQEITNGSFTDEWMTAAQWIADNVEAENIVHVIGAGDNTWTDSISQWNTAKAGWDLFTDKVSWSNMTGNHDYPGSCTDVNNPDHIIRDSTNYNNYFGIDYIRSTAAADTYGGSFADDYNIYGVTADANGKYSGAENSYYRFTVNGVRWMILQMEYHPRVSVIRWANKILAQYPDDNVILTTHGYIGTDNATYCGHWMPYTKSDAEIGGYIGELMKTPTAWPSGSEQPIWTELVAKNDNVKLLLCGHASTTDGHVLTRWDENEAGNTVPQVMINAQDVDVSYFEGQAMGMLGLLRFSADGTKAEIQYYSPYHDATYHPSHPEMLSLELTAKMCEHPTTEERQAIDPTCQKAGYTAGVWCTECECYVSGGKKIPAHATEKRAQVDATYTENGYTAGVWCTVCKKYVSGGEVIPAKGPLGDVDGSGKVDSTDARLVLQYAVKKITGTALNTTVADVDGSGKVDSTDARLILQYSVKKINKFPAA